MAVRSFKPIGIGAKGADVKKIAEALKKAGSGIKVTDVFHIGMRSAVACYQKKNRLQVTGIVDRKTWDKLMMPAPVMRKATKKK